MNRKDSTAADHAATLLRAIDELGKVRSIALTFQMVADAIDDQDDREALAWLGASATSKVEEVIALIRDTRSDIEGGVA